MADDLDVFMNLPDYVLFIIISFLPFKEAVRTSVLSKRWLSIWRSTKNVEFDEFFFVKDNDTEEERAVRRQDFIDLIKIWIEKYKEPVMDKLCLRLSNAESFIMDVERCITFCVGHSLKSLELDFSDPTWGEEEPADHPALLQLPSYCNHQPTLESLKLCSCRFFTPQISNLGALKEVSFSRIDISMKTVRTILDSCKMIESLSLIKCWNLDHFHIGGPDLQLRRLVIDKCRFRVDWFGIQAPKLQFFKYSGAAGFSEIEITRCMEEVDLDFGFESQWEEVGHYLYKYLEDIYPVKILTICSFMLKVIPSGEEPLRMQFPMNVQHLTMKASMHEFEFYGIKFFLNSCPNLETLTFEIVPERTISGYEPPFPLNPHTFWQQNVVVYDCLETTLKVVEVKGFKGTHNELRVLNYLVQCSRVLEKMNINVMKEQDGNGGEVDLRINTAEQLLNVPRASENLHISIR